MLYINSDINPEEERDQVGFFLDSLASMDMPVLDE